MQESFNIDREFAVLYITLYVKILFIGGMKKPIWREF